MVPGRHVTMQVTPDTGNGGVRRRTPPLPRPDSPGIREPRGAASGILAVHTSTSYCGFCAMCRARNRSRRARRRTPDSVPERGQRLRPLSRATGLCPRARSTTPTPFADSGLCPRERSSTLTPFAQERGVAMQARHQAPASPLLTAAFLPSTTGVGGVKLSFSSSGFSPFVMPRSRTVCNLSRIALPSIARLSE